MKSIAIFSGHVIAGLMSIFFTGSCLAGSVVVSDNFTGATNSQNWYVYGYACLTAGSVTAGSSTAGSSSQAGTIPACNPTTDTSGSGAMRLTPAQNAQAGGIIYGGSGGNTAFPSGTGINVSWTAYSYGGNGADGMSFFLLSSPSASFTPPTQLGSQGGSLGYSCSQNSSGKTSMNGIANGFLAVGMDEYGNFGNSSDNTGTGACNYGYYNSSTGQCSYNVGSTIANEIAIRGAGNLQGLSTYNYSACSSTTQYKFFQMPGTSYGVYTLPSNQSIANTNASTRSSATPIGYRLQITPSQLLTLQYSYNGGAWTTIVNGQSITGISGSTLPSYMSFGFAASTGGLNDIHEITCFQAAPMTTSSSGASLNNQQSSQLQTGSQAYLAYYNSNNWYGGLTSNPILANSNGTVSVSTSPSWDASCNLTGGSCATTGNTVATATPAPASRVILTSSTGSTTTGAAFEYNSSSTSSVLSNSTLMSYLRGGRGNEAASASPVYRTRTSVMGDVINSSPAWVGPPSQGYGTIWADSLNSSASLPENGSGATTYSAFKQTYNNRANIVYLGANDGMLHGFRSGSYDSTGTTWGTSTVANDGVEVLAYVPSTTYGNLSTYSQVIYPHQYFVDATPGSGDLFYNNNWHSWLVGGLGSGGQAIYALDATNPSQFSEANASSLVIGEWNSSSITCQNKTNCGNDLGYTFGTPVITRFHNGNWGAIFGNGYNSTTGVASIFVMMVNASSGVVSFYEYQTGSGSSSSKSGIYYTTAVDLDGDNIVDYVYAGDLQGNVWRFDLTNSNPTNWGVTNYSGSSPAAPLFKSSSSTPITTKLVVTAQSAGATSKRVMVYFGTGQKIPQTSTSPDTYATGAQYFMGVWDWNMTAWNSVSSTKFASKSSGPSGGSVLTGSTYLQQQTLSATNTTTNTGNSTISSIGGTSNNAVCWVDTQPCSSGNTQYGWQFTFPNLNGASKEQLIYNPQYLYGAIVFSSTIPAVNSVYSCTAAVDQGWTYALNPASGGNFSTSVFSNSSGTFSGFNNGTAVVQINAFKGNVTGSFQTVTYNNKSYLIYQTSSGVVQSGGNIMQMNPQNSLTGQRLTWIELR